MFRQGLKVNANKNSGLDDKYVFQLTSIYLFGIMYIFWD